MNLSHTVCPSCGSVDLLFSAKRQEHLCEDCGHRWALLAATAGFQWPTGLEPESLPTYLAAPLASLLAEPHPRVRLHWLVDCAEIAVRWSVAVALAEVLHAGDGALPEAIVECIRDQVERPTLGKWLGMLAALSAEPPDPALLAPGVFTVYRDCLAPAFRGEGEGGTPETSLLVLRNHLAHGGGVRTETARKLLAAHEPGGFELLRTVVQATGGAEVVAIGGGAAQRLAGPEPAAIRCPPALRHAPDGPYLVGEPGALPLLPLAEFGPIHRIGSAGRLEEQPGGPAAQLYLRGDSRRLTYVPVSGDQTVAYVTDVDAFRALFQLDAETGPSRSTVETFHWQSFLRYARVLQEDLVGRREELASLKPWLKGRDTRQDEVAADLGGSKPWQQGVYYHRFRAGDARNSLRAFLDGLIGALADWSPLPVPEASGDGDKPDTDQKLLEAARKRLGMIAGLTPPSPQAPPPRFLVLLDGLDEVLPYAPYLPAQLRELALPGTVWLIAGRPELALQQAFTASDCEPVFPDGLPPMAADDIRAMLLEGLANSRHALVARDEDTLEGVHNPFVERVVALADGLPLYVHLLIEDLRDGHLSVHDEQQLPQGLVAYYDALIDRIGISDLKRDLTLMVAVLARAEESLDAEALALLLADVPEDAPHYRARVENAHRGGQALLRTAPTADGSEGLTLYHQSFRDYVGGRPARGGEPSLDPAPALAGTVRDAEAKLCRLARGWAELPRGNLRNHLFRWGMRYALRWQGEAGLEDARKRLTDFVFLQAFTKELPSGAIPRLVADYETQLAHLPDGPDRQEFRLWEAFFREREHILRRGNEHWPAYKILLQLAVEHADDSPVTKAAEGWLQAGKCDWVWLRTPQRVAHAEPALCLRVLEGHTRGVLKAQLLSDGRIISSSWDDTIRLWDGRSSAPLATLKGYGHWKDGPQAISDDGRILSVSDKHILRLWDSENGAPLAILTGHTGAINGAEFLADGRILTWSEDRTLRLWDGKSGAPLATLAGHTGGVKGARAFPDGRILSWSKDRTLRLWDGENGALLATLAGHADRIRGADLLPNGHILSWSDDKTLRLWNGQNGALLATLAGHTDDVTGAAWLPNGRILSWSCGLDGDGTLRLWGGQSGALLATIVADTGPGALVGGALPLPEGNILSWSYFTMRLWDGQSGALLATLDLPSVVKDALALPNGRILALCYHSRPRLWDRRSGILLAILDGHTDLEYGALPLPDGRILTWSRDNTLRIWNGRGGVTLPPEATLPAQGGPDSYYDGVLPLSDGRVLSWLRHDNSLRLWDGESGAPLATLAGHTRDVLGAQILRDGHILSWSLDLTLRLWDGHSGALLATLAGHSHTIAGAGPLPDGRILSWSYDTTLRLWDGQSGAPLAILAGHTRKVASAQILPDRRILSWSEDRTLRLWDSQSGAPLAILTGHTDAVNGALLLSDGRILSWADDATLRLWDGQSGAPLATLAGHADRIRGADLLPNGHILSWSDDATLRLWDGQSGALLAILAGHTDGVFFAQVLPDGHIFSLSADDTVRLWEGQSGRPVGQPIQRKDLPWSNPQLQIHQSDAVFPAVVSGQTVGWAFGNTGGILSRTTQFSPICWQGHAPVELLTLWSNGILITRDLSFLQLYRGAKRITIPELEISG